MRPPLGQALALDPVRVARARAARGPSAPPLRGQAARPARAVEGVEAVTGGQAASPERVAAAEAAGMTAVLM